MQNRIARGETPVSTYKIDEVAQSRAVSTFPANHTFPSCYIPSVADKMNEGENTSMDNNNIITICSRSSMGGEV
jgi:hypothetical protein